MSMSRMSRAQASDADALLPVGLGTAVWAVVLVTLLLQRGTLEAQGRSWWLGVAAVGLVSGLGGLAFLTWRTRRRDASRGR